MPGFVLIFSDGSLHVCEGHLDVSITSLASIDFLSCITVQIKICLIR